MVSKKMCVCVCLCFFFFSCLSPIPTSSNNIFNVKEHWETLIILKNELNHQLNFVILKKIAYYEIFCKMFFFFTNLSQGNFLYCQRFFILIKNSVMPVLLLKWNKTCFIEFSLVKIFISFVKLLSINRIVFFSVM